MVYISEEAEAFHDALCFQSGYVGSGLGSILDRWPQDIRTAEGRHRLLVDLATYAEIMDKSRDELLTWYRERMNACTSVS